MDDASRGSNAILTVDLENLEITGPDGGSIKFDLDEFKRHCLLNGLDDIGLTLEKGKAIDSFEKSERRIASLGCVSRLHSIALSKPGFRPAFSLVGLQQTFFPRLQLLQRNADAAADFDQRIVEAFENAGMRIGNCQCGAAGGLYQDAIGIGKFQAGGDGLRIGDGHAFDRVMLRQIEDMLRHLARAETNWRSR